MFMLSFIFVIVCCPFEWKRICSGFLSLPLPLEIRLSRRDGCGSINRLNLATSLCPSQARTWISNVICRCSFFMLSELRCGVILFDIGGIVDHHCLNFFCLIIINSTGWAATFLCFNVIFLAIHV